MNLKICILTSCITTLFTGVVPITNHYNIKNISHSHREMIDFRKLSQIEDKYGLFIENKYNNFYQTPEDSKPIANDKYIEYSNNPFAPNTSFDMTTYFKNLYEYSPNNNIGSCGYVSLIQTMSYYDTFYNDNIIPEIFDRKYNYSLSETETKSHSPGTLKLFYHDSEYTSYYEFCVETQQKSFESYLTILYNLKHNTNYDSCFSYSIGGWEYEELLTELYGNKTSVIIGQYGDKSQTEYTQILKNIIDSGNPAIVHIQKKRQNGETYDHHSVVAYDYDEFGIYANFGWGKEDNRSLLLGGKYGYDEIYFIATLNYHNMGHSHSNNYTIDGKDYCGCNINDTIFLRNSSIWTNVPPIIYWMKNPNDPNETYTISFRNSPKGTNIISLTTEKNQLVLSYDLWKSITGKCINDIYISLKRNSKQVNYNEQISSFNKPYSILSYITLLSTDYGFADAYPIDDNTKNTYHRHYLKNGFSFRTRRYRTGYIHNEYVVMSCIKTGITEAFIEFAFDLPINKIEVELSHWREYSYEWLNDTTGIAELQVWHNKIMGIPFDNDKWIKKLDLLSKETAMPHDRTKQAKYIIEFEEPVYCFRFYSKINEETISTNNRGRICIGNMKLYFK